MTDCPPMAKTFPMLDLSPDEAFAAAPAPRAETTACVLISRARLTENYQTLQALHAPHSVCGAVLKANAYGLGMEMVAPLLATAGCENFFVATLDEALALRQTIPAPTPIFVFQGALPHTESVHVAHALTPCLSTLAQVNAWKTKAGSAPCALYLDTGMVRNGFWWEDVQALAQAAHFDGLNVALILSHLASPDEPLSSQNAQQKSRFDACLPFLPSAPCSLASSEGIFLGHSYHYDITRPGLALYGPAPIVRPMD